MDKYKDLLKYYLLILLPLKAVLVQTVSFGSIYGLPNPSQAFNFFFIFINMIFLLIYIGKLLYNRYFFLIFILLLTFFFVGLIRPIFSFYFTNKLYDFIWYIKLLSWMLVLPLSFIAFNTDEDIYLLRKSGIIAFLIIFVGLILGNIFKIGSTAYDFGIFHLGFWLKEAPLSLTLLGFTPFFFLPNKNSTKGKYLNTSGIIYLLINFSILCLVMKRSAILAFLISVIFTIYLFYISKKIVFNFRGAIFASLIIFVIVFGSYTLIEITNPSALKHRTKDFTMAEKSGDIKYIGSGRLRLAETYFQTFMEQSIFQKILGIDLLGGIDKRNRGYLYTDIDMPPHNDFIDVAMNNGLIGLGLYSSIFFFLFIIVLKVFRNEDNILLIYTSAVTLGSFTSYFIASLGGAFQSNVMMTSLMMMIGTNIGIAKLRYS